MNTICREKKQQGGVEFPQLLAPVESRSPQRGHHRGPQWQCHGPAALGSGQDQLSRWARQEGKMPTKETTSRYGEHGAGERAQAAEAGAWGATVGAGEAVRCVTRAGGRSILGGQAKEVRGHQRKLLRHSRGTGSTRPGSGSVSGRSVARRNEPEARLSLGLSDEPVTGGVHGRDGRG